MVDVNAIGSGGIAWLDSARAARWTTFGGRICGGYDQGGNDATVRHLWYSVT